MLSAQFHKKTKPQTSNCKAASAALSGFAFHTGALQPSALHLPPCSDFAMLRSSCRTFVSLCHSRFGKNSAKHRPSGRGPVPFAWARAHLAMFRRRKESFPDKARRAAFPVRQKMSAVIFRTSGKFLPGHYTGLCQPLFRRHIAPVKYIMRGSRHTTVTTDRMDSIPVGPLCPRTRSFRRKFPDDVHSGGHKAVTKF